MGLKSDEKEARVSPQRARQSLCDRCGKDLSKRSLYKTMNHWRTEAVYVCLACFDQYWNALKEHDDEYSR